MTRRRPLLVAQRDLWSLVSAAVEADALETARQLAAEVITGYGWDRYALGMNLEEDAVFLSPVVPAGWAYYMRDGFERCLLVNTDAAPLLSDWAHLATTMEVAEELGSGLVRLDEVLAEVLVRGMTAPEDAAGLTA